jgi:hypothetical protein
MIKHFLLPGMVNKVEDDTEPFKRDPEKEDCAFNLPHSFGASGMCFSLYLNAQEVLLHLQISKNIYLERKFGKFAGKKRLSAHNSTSSF